MLTFSFFRGPVWKRRVEFFLSCSSGQVTPDLRMWESCRTMLFVSGFPRGSPVSPAPSSRRHSILTPFTLIGSQYLGVKSRPNICTQFTHSNDRHPPAVDPLISATPNPQQPQVPLYRVGETGLPRENPPTNDIVRHDSHTRKSGVTRPGIEPESPW
ncbi:hypothetical protein PR048_009038 [Dryococelus australis]|uniref:Uncharacterized protein n=1 Tax=Dryococelus australis TaxID=614101 RepID=A0ABQ9HZN2_9NEOP|nr:hypothetical protein PR048_009038 [Dryococelus australis]